MAWQSIDTAPRDGTPILIWQPDHHFFGTRTRENTYDDKGQLVPENTKYYDDYRFAIGYWRPAGSWGNRNNSDVYPTHWQPLPAPPEEPAT